MNTDELVTFRRQLHKNPELSGKEFNTQKILLKEIRSISHDGVKKVGKTGIAVFFRGRDPGNKILIRADIDALPIQEENDDLDYRSVKKGVSHKCGHDGHSTILLGLAHDLSKRKIEKGEICLIFQPAEENGEGARAILDDPEFKFKADQVFALHNLPGYPLHQIVCRKDTFTAAASSVIIKIKGKTSHAAEPEKGINPGLAIAEILMLGKELSIPEMENPKFRLISLIYVTMGEKAYGISAGYGEVHLTLRTWNNDVMRELKQELMGKVEQICSKFELEMADEWLQNFFANQNGEVAYEAVKKAADQLNLEFIEREHPFKWGEDFGLFTTKFPGAMFGIGAGKHSPALHNPDYDFPDEIIETGIGMFRSIVNNNI